MDPAKKNDELDDELDPEEGFESAGPTEAEGLPPAAETTDGETIESVYTQAEVEAKLEEARERHLRLAAEYDNFRRRVQREKEQWTGEAIERFVLDLLPVLDDFDRAMKAARDAPSALAEGTRLTAKQLRAALARHGVVEIDPAGARFDPALHEAVQRVPPTDAAPPGTVVLVFEKGYTLRGRLLRPARVQVAGEP